MERTHVDEGGEKLPCCYCAFGLRRWCVMGLTVTGMAVLDARGGAAVCIVSLSFSTPGHSSCCGFVRCRNEVHVLRGALCFLEPLSHSVWWRVLHFKACVHMLAPPRVFCPFFGLCSDCASHGKKSAQAHRHRSPKRRALCRS